MNDKARLKQELERGLPVLVYDFEGREEEVDMVFYGGAVTPKSITTLRKEAGGLICFVTGEREGKLLGLPFFTEILREVGMGDLVKRPSYGDEPAFSLWVNHIETKTGISDNDRAKTIRGLHEVVKLLSTDDGEARRKFRESFMAPGHVPVLISRGVDRRRGHTELVMVLAEALGLERSMVIAEMLDEGASLSKEKAKKLAKNWGVSFLEGTEILGELA
ncbi:3,4-dihydroxy-2-butanone-4-phosphate synthase [Sulfodiicoccus acidiphilus]|uniref:3,4-dihydroxy-2-butanone-4-phosphate synthase n=1 Tax=Sulfodiicoccus acidiphilus TaxID=1670455 RepID=A0A348B185_9CREN|nr:3,4-dihydroxy-2-butanone-4-phosphate synthase [Sulfodiicoccus acidiphilus]BBD71937.1 3,4-dihydroxy-2-butanone-4-phosphate synthase [Sulfodiicoccus acidiphilus]GGT91596.1 3,4-dihydroxy-2-butanone-4-phosphate synthase [Sulfodiicoccus acidiphilus]